MGLTTLCYLEQDGKYLMLHRVKKKVDVNKDKWIGVGGHFEEGESPEECLLREVKEETGLTLTSWKFRGLVTFLSDQWEPEYMCLYTADGFEGEMIPCNEGTLEWIDKEKVLELNLWEGDRIFFYLMNTGRPFFSLKLQYCGNTLTSAVLDGKELELFDILTEDGKPTGLVRERTLVHRYGDPHATAHVWVVRRNEKGEAELLLQKRSADKDSFPGCYDISAAGHVQAGDSCLNTAVRELQEELGIAADSGKLRFVGIHTGKIETEFYGQPFRNFEISSVYLYEEPVAEEALTLQEAEVESVRFMSIAQIRKGMADGTIQNCLFEDEINLLENCLAEQKDKNPAKSS